jgi:hypothetical protein
VLEWYIQAEYESRAIVGDFNGELTAWFVASVCWSFVLQAGTSSKTKGFWPYPQPIVLWQIRFRVELLASRRLPHCVGIANTGPVSARTWNSSLLGVPRKDYNAREVHYVHIVFQDFVFHVRLCHDVAWISLISEWILACLVSYLILAKTSVRLCLVLPVQTRTPEKCICRCYELCSSLPIRHMLTFPSLL